MVTYFIIIYVAPKAAICLPSNLSLFAPRSLIAYSLIQPSLILSYQYRLC